METNVLPKIYLGTLLLYKVVAGYETCVIGHQRRYCENGCCSVGDANFCCLTTYMIIGIVFGCIAAVCSIASIIFCIMRQKKRSGQVLAQPTRLMVVSTQNHSTVEPPSYASVKPLPPGYSSHYYPTYPSGLPQYAANNQPPPPYSYTAPSTNPFAAAVAEVSGNKKQ